MTDTLRLTAAADRPLAWAEGDSVRYVVATLDALPHAKVQKEPAAPIHLALVIDASGSMSGDKLENAKSAALGVAERLRDIDRLSIVSFASDVIIHADALALSRDNRNAMRSAVAALHTRGNTNLSDGWLAGAECLAKAMPINGVNRVILFSDGEANAGITDLEQLATHATELAKRGIFTSTVGIGDGYNIELMQEISEHGGGRLHDAEHGAEITAALMGELGEIGDIAAQDVTVTLSVPATARAALVGSAPLTVGVGSLAVFVGTLLAGRPRTYVFRVTLPAGRTNDTLLFGVTARGMDPTSAELEAAPAEVAFTLAEGARNNRQPRNEAASMTVARAWHADIVRTASQMNRGGDRRHARHYVERELHFFERYCVGLPEARDLLKEIAVLKQNVDRTWDERTRKEMELGSYLVQSNRADYRGPKRAWADRMNDKQ